MPPQPPHSNVLKWTSLVYTIAGPELAPFVLATIQAESRGNPRAISVVGAKGLMQLMPGTIKDCGISDPFEPAENIYCGVSTIKRIRKLLNSIDPANFPGRGPVSEWEARIISTGYVHGWGKKSGVAKAISSYRGRSWPQFLRRFPKYAGKVDKYVSEVNRNMFAWGDYLGPGVPTLPPVPPVRVAGATPGAAIGLLLIALLWAFSRKA